MTYTFNAIASNSYEKEFQDLMKVETPIIQEFNGKKIYLFKNRMFRDKYPFIEPIKHEPMPHQDL